MIDRRHALPIVRHAKALNLSRGCVYYLPRSVSPIDLALMRRIDELHLEFPFAGSRMLRDLLNAEGITVGRRHVATLMKRMDITYIPMARGFVCLAAVVDWFSRRVLAWRVSITLEAEFCLEAVTETLARHGRPEMFDTDSKNQGGQFTSGDFTGLLLKHGIAIGMDGHGAWGDNVFVGRLWRSVKYEKVYLRAYDTVADARTSIGRYLDFYNSRRPHSSLDRKTPDQAYFHNQPHAAAD